MRLAVALIAGVLTGPAAAAEAGSTEAFVRALEAQPGVAVTHGDDGGRPYTEWRKAGVFYRLEARDGKETLSGGDESGAGAVMCGWMIYDAVRDALASCPADRFPALRADLDRDVPAIERFIAANSVLPTAVAELHAGAEARRARSAAPPSRPQAPVCTAEAAGGLVGALDAMGPEGRRAAVEQLLAVPRWPVLNPCL